jgi:soluble lytic murein transglycosylase-like protein
MKLFRRTLILTLIACTAAYLFDLTGGICQIAMGMPHRQNSPPGTSLTQSPVDRGAQQCADSRQAITESSSASVEPHAASELIMSNNSPRQTTGSAAEVSGREQKLLLPQRARKFQSYVERHSKKFKISSCLIYAVIEAESNFNVTAASPASAYGLMQLVPESGGRAAYRMVYGSDEIPSREYLEDPDKNIELGAAYLRLSGDFFAGVKDQLSREYCQIAAYNTGAGNVLKAFGGGYSQAIEMINSLSAPEVYEQLTTNLPYEETRNYLPKVLAYRREFASL